MQRRIGSSGVELESLSDALGLIGWCCYIRRPYNLGVRRGVESEVFLLDGLTDPFADVRSLHAIQVAGLEAVTGPGQHVRAE